MWLPERNVPVGEALSGLQHRGPGDADSENFDTKLLLWHADANIIPWVSLSLGAWRNAVLYIAYLGFLTCMSPIRAFSSK